MGVKNPEKLSEDKFNELLLEFYFIRNFDRKFYLSIARQAINEALQGSEDNE